MPGGEANLVIGAVEPKLYRGRKSRVYVARQVSKNFRSDVAKEEITENNTVNNTDNTFFTLYL